jgi:hypothetical protein
VSNSERFTRAAPERSRPHRGFTNILNQQTQSYSNGSDSRGAGGSEPGSQGTGEHSAGDSWTDTVGYSVKLGYRVIEEQIRQGQRIAQQVNSGTYGVGTMNNDVQELAQSIQRYCEDSAQLYMRLMGSMTSEMSGGTAANGDAVNNWMNGSGSVSGLSQLIETMLGNLGTFNVDGFRAPDGYQPAGGFSQQSSPGNSHTSTNNSVQSVRAMQVRVDDGKPVSVDVNLQVTACVYEVDRLHEKDPSIAALTEITLKNSDEGALMVSVTIADEQPDGTYSGIIYDAANRRHCGTLCVIVGTGAKQ